MDTALTRRSLVFAGAALLSVSGSMALRPTRRSSDLRGPVQLAQQVPTRFGDWGTVPGGPIVLPNPELQASLDALYAQTLTRTYRRADGVEVMLSIAYGDDQGSEATAVHRPEFCYVAQGFRITSGERTTLDLGAKRLEVQRLVTVLGHRVEPVMYWITIEDEATLPGLGRKLEQIASGLRGYVPDGMLVRVSSISRSGDPEVDFALQTAFLKDFFRAFAPAVRDRYFGA